tara:strand:+ start:1428 stop:2252 length:825 start_codon:yes stop_codon:yes gene_type:complete
LKLSVAIPTYNSSVHLKQLLDSLIRSKEIYEIVIRDDGSMPTEIEQLEKLVLDFRRKSKIKIKVHFDKINQGAFHNKYKCVEKCKGDIVYLIDSDNVVMNNLDNFIKKTLIPEFDRNSIYYASRVYQFFYFNKMYRSLYKLNKKYKIKFFNKDTIFSLKDVNEHIENYEEGNRGKFIDKHILWFLNTGNFFVDRNSFIEIFKEGKEINREILSIDAIVFSYLWLKSGKKIISKKEHYYYHRKRKDSVSFTEKDTYDISLNYLIDEFKKLKTIEK